MKFILYLQLQYKTLLSLFTLVLLPYTLLQFYFPYNIVGLEYIFLIILAIIRFSYVQKSVMQKKFELLARTHLVKTLKRTPSKNEIVSRVNDCFLAQDLAFGLCGLCIIALSVIRKSFLL